MKKVKAKKEIKAVVKPKNKVVADIDKIPEGRPPKFKSTEEMEKRVDDYFIYIKGQYSDKAVEVKEKGRVVDHEAIQVEVRAPEPPTVTGLALFLGFESRQSFHDYKEKDEFSYTIKRARLRIEHEYEKSLQRSQPTGAIFALKNMGWSDRQEIDHTSKGDKIETPLAPIIQLFNNAPPLAGSEEEIDTKGK